MSFTVGITEEAYELLQERKREGYPLKLLASEPIVEKYKAQSQAAAQGKGQEGLL